jgi:hypothetical protein
MRPGGQNNTSRAKRVAPIMTSVARLVLFCRGGDAAGRSFWGYP